MWWLYLQHVGVAKSPGRTVPLDADVLERRHKQELRPYLVNIERHDLTLGLWIEMLREQSQR